MASPGLLEGRGPLECPECASADVSCVSVFHRDTCNITFVQTHMHAHTAPPYFFQPPPPLQLSINFPFCLVAADIPNTAISGLASDLAPWKPSTRLPAQRDSSQYWINNSLDILLQLNKNPCMVEVCEMI